MSHSSNEVLSNSAQILDDHYFFAGSYSTAVGEVASVESLENVERAISSSDPNSVVHFVLTEQEINNANEILA